VTAATLSGTTTVTATTPSGTSTVAAASPTIASTDPAATRTGTATTSEATPTISNLTPPTSPTIALPTPTSAATIGASDTVTVIIQYYLYLDDNFDNVLTVPAGTRVVWIAKDDDAHTVSSIETPRVLNSPNLLNNETYEFTFTEPGQYDYFCVPHPDMTGVVIVE
jgi:plastocyanin